MLLPSHPAQSSAQTTGLWPVSIHDTDTMKACPCPSGFLPCLAPPSKALITAGHELTARKDRCRGTPGSGGSPGKTLAEGSSQAQAADGQEKRERL